jgi:ATP/maltotriose-dependent transcriptional regulator MalT
VARRVSCPTLVGRATEVSRLGVALSQAQAGSTVLLFVSGEAGIGKTRLVETFTAQARQRGALVFSGGCLDLAEGAAPYAPFIAALRPLAGQLSNEELAYVLGENSAPGRQPARGPRELGALLPELCGRPPQHRDGIQRGRLYEMALGLFERMASLRPAVLVLEDLHWIDVASRDLLAVLGGNLREAGLLIVGTYRSDEVTRDHPLHGILLELDRSGRAERVEISGLTQAEVTRQVTGILGTEPAARQVRSLHDRSEGNPFFVEELVAAGPAAEGLPATVREVLLTRIERLDADTRRVLRAVAIIGRVSDDGLIGAVTGLSGEPLDVALHEAVNHRLLIATDDGYNLRHALLREALTGDLLPGERNRLHAAAGAALEERAMPGDARIAAEPARHWYAAGDTPRALTAFIAAADAAATAYASGTALTHYERALSLWPLVPDAAVLTGIGYPDLLQRTAQVAMAAGENERAVALIDAAVAESGVPDGVPSAVDALRIASLLTLQGRIRWMAGETAAAFASYDAAIAVLPADRSSRERAQLRAVQGHALMLRSQFADAVTCCREAIAIAAEVDAPDLEGYARNSLGVSLAGLGDLDGGLTELIAARRIAGDLGDAWELSRAYVNHADALLLAARWTEAAEVGLEGVKVCRRLGYGRTICMCTAGNALAALIRLGRWEEAERVVAELLELGAAPWQRWGVTLARVDLEVRRGNLEAALPHLAEVAGLVIEADDIDLTSSYQATRARLSIERGDYTQARTATRAGLDAIAGSEMIRIGPELCALALRAEADAAETARVIGATIDVDGAQQLMAHCKELADRMRALPDPQAQTLMAVAELSRLGSPEPGLWADAVVSWDGLGEPYQSAYCRFRQASAILAGRGARHDATSVLSQAHETAVRLGAEPLREEIEALAKRARLDLSVAAVDGPVGETPVRPLGLTGREREIIALLGSGQTNRQIAGHLFISERTVAVHVSHILHKLGVTNRVAAADLARRLGL